MSESTSGRIESRLNHSLLADVILGLERESPMDVSKFDFLS
jgi:hypothetical protein